MDDRIMASLESALGHPPPFGDDELRSLRQLDVTHARTLDGVDRCSSLAILTMVGCDVPSYEPLAMCRHITTLSIESSNLGRIGPLSGLPLFNLQIRWDRVSDLAPVLEVQPLMLVDARGNPLTPESYDEVASALRHRGCTVELSDRPSWELTHELHAAGIPASVYDARGGYYLCFSGLSVTSLPEYGHAPVSLDDVRRALPSRDAVVDLYESRRPRAQLDDPGPGVRLLAELSGEDSGRLTTDLSALRRAIAAFSRQGAEILYGFMSEDPAQRAAAVERWERMQAALQADPSEGPTRTRRVLSPKHRSQLRDILSRAVASLEELEKETRDRGNSA